MAALEGPLTTGLRTTREQSAKRMAQSDGRRKRAKRQQKQAEGRTLSANISETLTLPEFSVEGGEGIDDGNDGCYAIIHLGCGSVGVGDKVNELEKENARLRVGAERTEG